MDYDAVEMIIDQLEEYALPAEDGRMVKELKQMLKSFDWDGMEAVVQRQATLWCGPPK